MSRFHFHVRKGEVLEESDVIVEIEDSEEAIQEEAIEAARDLLAEGDLAGLDRRSWAFEVVREGGEPVMTVPFAEAIEPDLPE